MLYTYEENKIEKGDETMKKTVALILAMLLALSALLIPALAEEEVSSAPVDIVVGEEEALLNDVEADAQDDAQFAAQGNEDDACQSVMASESDDALALTAFPGARLMSEVNYTANKSGKITMPRPYGYKMDTSYFWSGNSGQTLSIQFTVGAEFGTQPYNISYKVYCGGVYLTGDSNMKSGSRIQLTGGNAYGIYSFVVAVEDGAGNYVCTTLGEKVNVGFSSSNVIGNSEATAPMYPDYVVSAVGSLESYTGNEEEVVIPQALGVTGIESYAFGNCSNATSITIPKGVTSISDYAFCKNSGYDGTNFNQWLSGLTSKTSGCPNLKHLYLPNSLKTVSAYAFAYLPSTAVIHTTNKQLLAATGVKLDVTDSFELTIGKTRKLTATLTPSYASSGLKWKSSNQKVATVTKNGKIKAVKAGKAVITVTALNGKKSASVTVNVVAPQPTSVKIANGKSAKLKVGETLQLETILKPTNAKSKITWTTGDRRIATVSSKGVVKAKKAGKVKITATTVNGLKASITIKIKKQQ